MARRAAELGADWVINADADEFHWPAAGTLAEVFAAVPAEYDVLEMPVSHFPPRPGDRAPWHRRMQLRETLSLKPSGGSYARNVAHRARKDITVGVGNHSVSGPSLSVVPGWRPITVLHFPLRTFEQYERKIASAGPAFTGGYNFVVAGEKKHGIWAIYEAGLLRESYAAKLVTDEKAAEYLQAGSLVHDPRLSAWLDGDGPLPGSPAACGGARAWPEEPPAVAELRLDCARACLIAQRAADEAAAELSARTRELKERVAELKERISELSERCGTAEAEVTARTRELKERIAELKRRSTEASAEAAAGALELKQRLAELKKRHAEAQAEAAARNRELKERVKELKVRISEMEERAAEVPSADGSLPPS